MFLSHGGNVSCCSSWTPHVETTPPSPCAVSFTHMQTAAGRFANSHSSLVVTPSFSPPLCRRGVVGSARRHHHPVPVGSQHSLGGDPDLLQPEQAKRTEQPVPCYQRSVLANNFGNKRQVTGKECLRAMPSSHSSCPPVSVVVCFDRPAERSSLRSSSQHTEGPAGLVSVGNPRRVCAGGTGVLADGPLRPHL